MNEFFFALANFFFVLAGFLTFLIESFSPSKEEMARKIAEEEKIPPDEAGNKAENKMRKRRLMILIPWMIGMFFNALGFLSF
jgi:hypothetical protein